ncbi:hypothetical protein G6F65_022971 [Rhizopus arrhizus]|nr:hypothetical protein G6F65_022971 [Rhizopus arrhizus]KAG1253492.1 hypothetical protein G6F68_011311 [Rhizopus microsporus]
MNHEHPDIESQQTAADAAATAGVNDELERLRAEVEQVRADALRPQVRQREAAGRAAAGIRQPGCRPQGHRR